MRPLLSRFRWPGFALLLVTALVVATTVTSVQVQAALQPTTKVGVSFTARQTHAHNQQFYSWVVSSTVTPAALTLKNLGAAGYLKETVTLVKSAPAKQIRSEGAVCVTNSGQTPTVGLVVNVDIRYPSDAATRAALTPPTSVGAVLPPGVMRCFPYVATFLADPLITAPIQTTATITITNYDGSFGIAFGPSPLVSTAAVLDSPTLVNNALRVTTPSGNSFTTVAGGSYVFAQPLYCPGNAGVNTPTFTVPTTGQTSSNSVTLTCVP